MSKNWICMVLFWLTLICMSLDLKVTFCYFCWLFFVCIYQLFFFFLESCVIILIAVLMTAVLINSFRCNNMIGIIMISNGFNLTYVIFFIIVGISIFISKYILMREYDDMFGNMKWVVPLWIFYNLNDLPHSACIKWKNISK